MTGDLDNSDAQAGFVSPICITGMHRSGTSMVSRLLNLCGLYLGLDSELSPPARDNQEGFWENVHFVEMNDRILTQLDAGWDLPPTRWDGWKSRLEFTTLRTEATDLIDSFAAHQPWGWKDPRNSLTLPFWTDLIPSLRVVICLRNPLEVAQSLQLRNFCSIAFGLELWLVYNQRLLDTVRPENRVVTHYDAYFNHPEAELQRVLRLVNIPATDEEIKRACLTASADLRHQKVPIETLSSVLPPDILKCYLELCAQAGPVYKVFHRKEGGDVCEQLEAAKGNSLQHSSQAPGLIKSQFGTDTAPQTIVSLTESLKAQLAQNEKFVHEQEEAVRALEEKLIQLQHAVSRSQENHQPVTPLTPTLMTQIESLDNVITALQDEREQWEAKNQLLLAQLSAKAGELNQITQSLGWKVLSLYGKLKYRYLLPLYRILRLPPYR